MDVLQYRKSNSRFTWVYLCVITQSFITVFFLLPYLLGDPMFPTISF